MSSNSFDNLFSELAYMLKEAFGNYSNEQYTINPELWKCTREDTRSFLISFMKPNNPVRAALPLPFVKLMMSPENVIDTQEWDEYISAGSNPAGSQMSDKFILTNQNGETAPECSMTTFQKFKFLSKNSDTLLANVRFIKCSKQLDLLKQSLEHFGLYENGQNPFYYNTTYTKDARDANGRMAGREQVGTKGIMLGVLGMVILYSQTVRGNLLASVKGLNQMSLKAFEYFPSADEAKAATSGSVDIDNTPDGDPIDNDVEVGFGMVGPNSRNIDNFKTGQYYYSTDNSAHARPLRNFALELSPNSAFVGYAGRGNMSELDYREKALVTLRPESDSGWESRSDADSSRFKVIGSILRQMNQYAEDRKNGTITGDISEHPPISERTTWEDSVRDNGVEAITSPDLLNSAELEGRTANFQQAIETYLYERRDMFFAPDIMKQYWVVGMDDATIDSTSQSLINSDNATEFINILKDIDVKNRTQLLNMTLTVKAAHNAKEELDSSESSRKSVIDQVFSDCEAKKVIDHDRNTIHQYFDAVDKLVFDTNWYITQDAGVPMQVSSATGKGGQPWDQTQKMTGQRKTRRHADWDKGPQPIRTVKGVDTDFDWRNDVDFSNKLKSLANLYQRMAMSKDYMEQHGMGKKEKTIPGVVEAAHYYAQADYADAKGVLGPMVVAMAKLFGEDKNGALGQTDMFIKDLPSQIENMVNQFVKNSYKSMDKSDDTNTKKKKGNKDNSRISSYSADVFSAGVANKFGLKKLSASTPVHIDVYSQLEKLKRDFSVNLIGALMQMKNQDDDDSIDFKLVNYIYKMGDGNDNIKTRKFLFKVGWSDNLKKYYKNLLDDLKTYKAKAKISGISSQEFNDIVNKFHVSNDKAAPDTDVAKDFWNKSMKGEDTQETEDTLLSVFKLLMSGADALKEYKEIYSKIKDDYDAFMDELDNVFKTAPTQTMRLFVRNKEIKPADGVQPRFADFAPSFDDYRQGVFIKEYIRRLTNWCSKSSRMREFVNKYNGDSSNATTISMNNIAEMVCDAWNTLLDGNKKIRDNKGAATQNAVGGTGNFNDADLSVAAWIFGQELGAGIGDLHCDPSTIDPKYKNALLGAFFNKFWFDGRLGDAKDIMSSGSDDWSDQWERVADLVWKDTDSDSIFDLTLLVIANKLGDFMQSYRIRSYMNKMDTGNGKLDDMQYGDADTFTFDMNLLSTYKYNDEQAPVAANSAADNTSYDDTDISKFDDGGVSAIPDDNDDSSSNDLVDDGTSDDNKPSDIFDVGDEDDQDDQMPI